MLSPIAAISAAREFSLRSSRHHSHPAKTNDLALNSRRTIHKHDFRYVAEDNVYICRPVNGWPTTTRLRNTD